MTAADEIHVVRDLKHPNLCLGFNSELFNFKSRNQLSSDLESHLVPHVLHLSEDWDWIADGVIGRSKTNL